VYELSNELVDMGYDVTVICKWGGWYKNQKYKELLYFSFNEIKKIINEYDIIHYHSGLGNTQIEELKKIKPIYMTIHGEYMMRLQQSVIDDKCKTITVNQSIQNLFPNKKMSLTINGVRSKLNEPVIYIVSRLENGKMGIINAMIELIRENKIFYKVKVLGNGVHLKLYKEKTQDIQDKIEFVGAVEDIKYNQQDIIIGVGRVFLEGVMSGCRCIIANDRIYECKKPLEELQYCNFNARYCDTVTKEKLFIQLQGCIDSYIPFGILKNYTVRKMAEDYLILWN
jgi:hypothetical protein